MLAPTNDGKICNSSLIYVVLLERSANQTFAAVAAVREIDTPPSFSRDILKAIFSVCARNFSSAKFFSVLKFPMPFTNDTAKSVMKIGAIMNRAIFVFILIIIKGETKCCAFKIVNCALSCKFFYVRKKSFGPAIEPTSFRGACLQT